MGCQVRAIGKAIRPLFAARGHIIMKNVFWYSSCDKFSISTCRAPAILYKTSPSMSVYMGSGPGYYNSGSIASSAINKVH